MVLMTSVRIPSIKLPYVTRPSLMKALKKKKKVHFFCMAASLDIFVSDPP